jgi:hypothetical protein
MHTYNDSLINICSHYWEVDRSAQGRPVIYVWLGGANVNKAIEVMIERNIESI